MHLFPCVSHGFCYTTCMTERVTRTIGTELTFDGGTWGVVDFIDNTWTIVEGKQIGIIIVIDEDGGEHELTEARID